MLRILAITLLCIPVCAHGILHAAESRDLSGEWRFAMDRNDEGVNQAWFNRDLKDGIALPGILQAQGYGDDITAKTPWVLSLYDKNWDQREDYKTHTAAGNVKVPFLSQPPKHYLGAAWYQRDIDVPAAWRGKRVALFLERPRWGSTLWIDERKVGSNLSLVAEHEYDLGLLAPGRHRISVRVDNRMLMAYRPDAHSVSDSLGMSWNGIVGKMELRATSPVWLDDAQVYPDVKTKTARVKITVGNAGGRAGSGTVTANGVAHKVKWNAQGGSAEIKVRFPANTQTWDEFNPAMQNIRLQLKGAGAADTRDVSFGFAQIAAKGNQFLLNGRTLFLRGTHHGGDFPLTGYPPTDVAYWRKIIQINKDWGINHIRFHSFCPPEAAFQAADELGVYLQPEPGMWNEVSPGTAMDKMLYEETERMIKAYGNHPSFILLSPANEPKGRWKEAFDAWIAHYRKADPRRLYANGTGHTEKEVPGLADGTDFLSMQRIGPKPLRGDKGWFGRDYGASLAGINVPVVSHETGQWAAYPDYDIIRKFRGYLRPGNYEISGAGLQGGDRSEPAHARLDGLSATRSARLSGPRHGAGRHPGHVLGAKRLRDRRGIPALQWPDRAAGAPAKTHLEHRRNADGGRGDRPLRRRRPGRRAALVEADRRHRPRRRRRRLPPQDDRHRQEYPARTNQAAPQGPGGATGVPAAGRRRRRG
jgi:hypothetical protein